MNVLQRDRSIRAPACKVAVTRVHGYDEMTAREFAEAAVRFGVIDEAALMDPSGYDRGKTLRRLENLRRWVVSQQTKEWTSA